MSDYYPPALTQFCRQFPPPFPVGVKGWLWVHRTFGTGLGFVDF